MNIQNNFQYQCTFERLPHLFIKSSPGLLILKPDIGKGSVQFFQLDRGLEARFWNCTFNAGVELYGDNGSNARSRYFTLLCFQDTNAFTLCHSNTFLHKKILWNTAFLSSNCSCKMQIAPGINSRCLSISFTETWFRQNLHESKANPMPQKLNELESMSLVGNLHKAEMKIVEELMDFSWKNSFGTFYIKSHVLKLISDVMYRVKQRESFSINHLCLQTRVPEIEKLLR